MFENMWKVRLKLFYDGMVYYTINGKGQFFWLHKLINKTDKLVKTYFAKMTTDGQQLRTWKQIKHIIFKHTFSFCYI